MLERATACLRTGARDSLKCAQHCPQSRSPSSGRVIHHSLWKHGADDIDPSIILLSAQNAQTRRPTARTGSQRTGNWKENGMNISTPNYPDGPFLDFLYPPHALNWLQRCNRWKRRKSRRMSNGFIPASRSYSSSSYGRLDDLTASNSDAKYEESQELERCEDTKEFKILLHQQSSKFNLGRDHQPEAEKESSLNNSSMANIESELANSIEKESGQFRDSAGDLAELDTSTQREQRVSSNPLHELRSLLAGLKPAGSQDKTARAWALYNMLDDVDRQDIRLKNELLVFLAARHDEIADAHCISLYLSLPLESRSLATYQGALNSFLRRKDYDSALGLHQEALSNLQNSSQITKTLFSDVVQKPHIETALAVMLQHHAALPSQKAIFWLNASEIPDLTNAAARFARSCRTKQKSVQNGTSGASFPSILLLSAKLSEEAITQLVAFPLPPLRDMEHCQLSSRLYLLCDSIFRWNPAEAPRIFENAIVSVLQQHGAQVDGSKPCSRIEFAKIYHIISYMYRLYRKSPGFRPSELLLTLFFNQLLHYNVAAKQRSGQHTVPVTIIIEDWKAAHTKLSLWAVSRLMGFHALNGHVEKVTETFQYLLQYYPSFADQKDALWALLYVHARRADVASATRTFNELRKLAEGNHDTVDPKWWNILLTAHTSSDDTDGAFATFKAMLDSGVKPSIHSMGPVLKVLAVRGDVEGIENWLQQYDALSGASRNTEMMACLVGALAVDGRTEKAEVVLRETIAKCRVSQITGSPTLCFNAIIQAHAHRKDLDAVVRLYSWMKAEGVRRTNGTYALFMRALCNHRQTNGAWKLLTHALPREGLEANAHHFAIVMEGYNNQGLYARALQVHKKMLDKGLRSNLAIRKACVKAQALSEQRLRTRRGRNRDAAGNPVPLAKVVRNVEREVCGQDGSEVTQGGQNIALRDMSASSVSELLHPVMLLHAKRRNRQVVERLYEIYKTKTQEAGKQSGTPPLRVLGAAMSASMYAGRYNEVEQYWNLAKDVADIFTAPVAAPDFRRSVSPEADQELPILAEPEWNDASPAHVPDGAEIGFAANKSATRGVQTLLPRAATPFRPQPVPGRRQILSTVVRYYFRALVAQDRTADLVKTLTLLLKQGYTLDNTAWNRVIEFLCAGSAPLALLAFSLTERFLIPNFAGWRKKSARWKPGKAAISANMQHMKARYFDTRNVLMPQYRTMQHLAAALLKIQKLEMSGNSQRPPELSGWIGSMAQIRHWAPQTLRAVQNMPHVDDYWQDRLLRRGGEGYHWDR